jgi:hypothetical protein
VNLKRFTDFHTTDLREFLRELRSSHAFAVPAARLRFQPGFSRFPPGIG